MIAENVPVLIVGSTRADDIVRDADSLHLYRKAGVIRWLLGMENTNEATLHLIRKGGSTASDREAIRLLRQHGILSMATWVAGFEDEGFRDLWRGFRQLIAYDPDQIQALYVTPHRWTPFFRIASGRKVIQPDVRLWDYKHQVLKMTRLQPWMLFFSVKLIELAVQFAPEGARPHPVPPGSRAAPFDALVHADGPPRLVPRGLGFPGPRRPLEGRPDAGRVLGRAARCRGGIDDCPTPGALAGQIVGWDVAGPLSLALPEVSRYRLMARSACRRRVR